MDTRELLAPDTGPPLGRSRGRVLELLRGTDGPLTVAEVAEHSGLHPNTARFHLDALVDAGLAARGHGPGRARHAPGRPAVGYRAVVTGLPGAPSGERRYRLLAEMLASLVVSVADDPALAAERAGREWGSYLTEPPPSHRQPSVGDVLADLTGLLASIGFDPQAQPGKVPGTAEMLLRECPFREVARKHQAVVCSMHLGIIRSALDRMRAPLAADRLEVFPEPGLCRAHFTRITGLAIPKSFDNTRNFRLITIAKRMPSSLPAAIRARSFLTIGTPMTCGQSGHDNEVSARRQSKEFGPETFPKLIDG